MRVLYITAEVFPLAKTGGLADVSAALPATLREEYGIDVHLLLPAYPGALDTAKGLRVAAIIDDLLGLGPVRLWEGLVPDGSVPVWLVDCPELYDRKGNPYQDEDGCDFADNALRFGLLNHVGAAIAAGGGGLRWLPDLVHLNDWHTALVPLILRKQLGHRPPTLLTVHNLAYQGNFPMAALARLDLARDRETYAAIAVGEQLSFLKAGICYADQLTTVSPTYAGEVQTTEYGCGLEHIMRRRADRICGILNGADYKLWNPAKDPYLDIHYDVRNLRNKRLCKATAQKAFGLEPGPKIPVVGFSSRLAWQKMPDIVLAALPELLAADIQFVLVAEGDLNHEAAFRRLAAAHPGRVGVQIGYDEAVAHRLMAGADMLLCPARYEPCGLSAIYASRYGTVPIARRTGGLSDTIVDARPPALADGSATGFLFDDPSASSLIEITRRALRLYELKGSWRRMQVAGMCKDYGWRRAAQEYATLYRQMTGRLVHTRPPIDHEPTRLVA